MSTDQRRFNQYSETIIGCAFEVANTLGRGFVGNIYANALAREEQRQTLDVRREFPVKVHYKEELVGEFFCDLLVEGSILEEIKAASGLNNLHMAQCLNYLKATGYSIPTPLSSTFAVPITGATSSLSRIKASNPCGSLLT